jgi:hypothetical protein
MGAVEEIHDRERTLIWRLAPLVLARLREDDRQGAVTIEDPDERRWGEVSFRVQVHDTPVLVTLHIDP